MEFLYKLYDMEYFAVGLLIVIAILVFLFLLILFFGKKEEKERKLEETNRLNLESTNAFKEVEAIKEELKIPEIPQPTLDIIDNDVKEEMVQEPTFDVPYVEEPLKTEISNSESFEMELPKVEPIKLDESFVSDITTNLNDSEIVEENSVEIPNVEPVLPEINIDSLFQTNLDEVQPEEKNEEQVEVSEIPKIETPKVEAPFSSVYTNNEMPRMVEEVKTEEKKPVTAFELPKMAEMPKLKEESNIEKVNDFDSLFGDIEPETYSIKK